VLAGSVRRIDAALLLCCQRGSASRVREVPPWLCGRRRGGAGAGCLRPGVEASDEQPGAGDPSALAFEFQLDAPLGQISQTLTIENSGGTGLAPVLELTPLDASGEPIPGVTARTAYGSDRGEVVVPPYTAVLDVVRFDGRRKRDVEDVAVRGRRETAEEPEIQRLDHGREVPYESFFDSVRVSNVDQVAIEIRVVLIEYEDPPPGESQQFIRATVLSSLLKLPPGAEKTLRLPRELRGRVIGSVKPYFSR
jgi:hypothetical protein